jgi:hypothetical protein
VNSAPRRASTPATAVTMVLRASRMRGLMAGGDRGEEEEGV